MRKRTTSRAKETIKEATTKATEAVKETVEKTTVKASEVIEEAKDAAADIAKAPVVEEAKETVKKAVKEVAKGFKVVAKSEDGIVEAIENKNIIAVQWHPEYMNDIKFFEYFINKISNKDH